VSARVDRGRVVGSRPVAVDDELVGEVHDDADVVRHDPHPLAQLESVLPGDLDDRVLLR
jgi:hypothetical protein